MSKRVAVTGGFKFGNTAVPRRDLEKIFNFLGWTLVTEAKNADVLYAANPTGNSAKLRQAMWNGVEVRSYDDLLQEMLTASGHNISLTRLIHMAYKYENASFQRKMQLVARVGMAGTAPKEVAPKTGQVGLTRKVKL